MYFYYLLQNDNDFFYFYNSKIIEEDSWGSEDSWFDKTLFVSRAFSLLLFE